ncbi:hypothetical protein FZ997_24465 [Salmonella enterica subsp. enterica serovar Typhimurium]|nr:hypothetical protein FYM02_22710 [Salmonella enterica subsp. enterica serovar Typhimurium]TZF18995.1 hypothetical protein FZ997_24465 [Salmonella enterica subsp. enterica serovar Typhimurium]
MRNQSFSPSFALSPASGTFITFCALTFPPHSGLRMPRTATSWASCLFDILCRYVMYPAGE